MELTVIALIGIITLIPPTYSVPCIDKTHSCTADQCGGFELITYDICRKTCNQCDGPVLDYSDGATTPTTLASTTTSSTTTSTTTTSTTTQTTTTPTTTIPTTTMQKTTTALPTTILSTTMAAITTGGVTAVCADKITSCSINANVVCGNDYHFTYDLCRKTCGQCNGPAYTAFTTAPAKTTTAAITLDSLKEIECYYDGNSQGFDGKTSMTSPSNHSCVNWANIASLEGYTDQQFPGGDFHHNFCRDPTNTGRPFCHTIYGKEACGLRKCAGTCMDSATFDCPRFGTSACGDDEFARTTCPVTCNKCGHGIILQAKTA